MIYKVLYIPGGDRRISINSINPINLGYLESGPHKHRIYPSQMSRFGIPDDEPASWRG